MSASVVLPPLPSKRIIAAVCEEVAARERIDAGAIEKDFYLTRLIWAIAQALGDGLLLKGGTLLSKVDIGYFRMSEDVDEARTASFAARRAAAACRRPANSAVLTGSTLLLRTGCRGSTCGEGARRL